MKCPDCGSHMTKVESTVSVPAAYCTLLYDWPTVKETRRVTGKQTVLACDGCERIDEVTK